MRTKTFHRLFTILMLSVSFIAQAEAQSDEGTAASPTAQPALPPVEPYPAEGVSEGYLFNLRPWGRDLGKTLADQGIYITGRTINEGYANISGGLQRGWLYQGYTSLGVDLDMNRIVGIPGGSVHILVDDLNGVPTEPFSGSAFAFNRVFSLNAALRLNEFSYEQSLFNDNLDVRVGRIPVGFDFDYSDLYCQFINGLCALPGAYAFDKGSPSYLTASWAAVTKVRLPYSFYFNVGVYEDEPLLNSIHHDDWPGEDWDFNKGTGVTIPMQFGYRTTFKNDPYPRAFDIGGFIDTGTYSDPLLNAAGKNRIVSGGAARVDQGRSGLWLQGQQVVWRPDMTNERALYLFGGANFTTSGEPSIASAFFVGLSMKGLLASRPNDSINFEAQWINLNPLLTTAIDSSLRLQHTNQTVSSSEEFIEVNYGLQLAPGINFKPFLQYIWNPDQSGLAKPSPSLTHTFFVGAAVSVFWADAFGLPKLGGL
ncbi:MAG: carbohydrate porin [Methylocella sp.]